MSAPSLRESQLAMARYLRDPVAAPPPAGIEQRRLDIYQRLVYNNIEAFISGGFPVLRSLYLDEDWHHLVRAFIDTHRCHTPYFLEISQEFIQFLMQGHTLRDCDPPFMVELAHYEWVELALDVALGELLCEHQPASLLEAIVQLSPLAWLLHYQYPVHRIGPAFRPLQPEQPTYLVVYRDRREKVRFMELNPMSARLVELTRDNSSATVGNLLATLAAESGLALTTVLESGTQQVAELLQCGVLGPVPAED